MKTILVIEDDFVIRDNLREILEYSGYKVHLTSDGSEGIRAAREIKPDLIISDIIMRGLDGYAVKQKISEYDETKAIPFIFLTAKADVKDIRMGMDYGADDYIVKPYRAHELLNTIKKRIERISELQNSNNSVPPQESRNDENKIIISEKNSHQVIKYEEIILISAAGDYTYLHLKNGKKLLVRKLLGQWEKTLPADTFFRIHKSTMVNLTYVEKIIRLEKKTSVVRLQHYQEPVIISQRNIKKLKTYLLERYNKTK